VSRTASNDKRVAWFATWIFFSTSWVGQDYFAPQAINFLFFLGFMAIALRYFRTEHLPYPKLIDPFQRVASWIVRRVVQVPLLWKNNPSSLEPGGSNLLPADRRGRTLLLLAMLVIFGAMVVSHQLTPFFVLLDLGILAILARTKLRTLPLLLIIILF